ncbi:hypothetical protein KCP73_11205 [Salmonella enterica subsp. enterica]|nr:hypothetical protein KCP73_11205 [Salmonella enterica subsp. enterica]
MSSLRSSRSLQYWPGRTTVSTVQAQRGTRYAQLFLAWQQARVPVKNTGILFGWRVSLAVGRGLWSF